MSGDPIPGPQATELGITDEVATGDVVDAAIEFAQKIIQAGGKVRRIRDEISVVEKDRDNQEIFENARKSSARKMRNRFAPEMIIQCVEAAVHSGDFDTGLKVEQECFAKCLKHPQREALIHMFSLKGKSPKSQTYRKTLPRPPLSKPPSSDAEPWEEEFL